MYEKISVLYRYYINYYINYYYIELYIQEYIFYWDFIIYVFFFLKVFIFVIIRNIKRLKIWFLKYDLRFNDNKYIFDIFCMKVC